MGVPRREVWLAVAAGPDGAVWPLEHEGDYHDGDVLVHIKPGAQQGVEVNVIPTAIVREH